MSKVLVDRELLERVRELFNYDEHTGHFTWKVRTTNSINAGDRAGWIRPDGYIGMRFDGRYFQAHRLAWLYIKGELPLGQIDHINGVRTDNRIVNLRDVAHKDNGRNQRLAANNKSGANGVHWFKSRGKWRAEITIDGRKVHLGYFGDLDAARSARKDAERRLGFHNNHGQPRSAAMAAKEA